MPAHPFDNLIRTGISSWPPPEIIQKLYKSRQSRAFEGKDLAIATSDLGYYCDLQSLHSEDAITWSVFGTIARAPQAVLEAWLKDLFRLLYVTKAVSMMRRESIIVFGVVREALRTGISPRSAA
jgi:hypothetical protein